MEMPLLKCGCRANSMGTKAGESQDMKRPACVIHDCFEVADEQPNLEGRTARCAYYGRTVKRGWYNSNACNVCKAGESCACERPSSLGLWFFQYHPDKPFDEFYCACQGAD